MVIYSYPQVFPRLWIKHYETDIFSPICVCFTQVIHSFWGYLIDYEDFSLSPYHILLITCGYHVYPKTAVTCLLSFMPYIYINNDNNPYNQE